MKPAAWALSSTTCDPSSPATIHPGVAVHYLTRSAGAEGEVGPANIVTSVLGDYRGYDTMGETVVIFTASIQFFLIGLLGEYIARIYTEVKNRPHYIVRDRY